MVQGCSRSSAKVEGCTCTMSGPTLRVRHPPCRAIGNPWGGGMKPGMQRDILVAYWLLFDEFEIGEDDPPAPTEQPTGATPTVAAKEPEKPKRNNSAKGRKRS